MEAITSIVAQPVDASWTDLKPVDAMEPLALIRSQTVDKTGTANQGLSVDDAWEIAMAWGEPLLNKVRLVPEQQGPQISIVDSVAWVRFKMRLSNHTEMSIARAAAVTWSALASCPGYGGQENPVFWKCVFSELTKQFDDDISDRGNVRSVSDSVGFFDKPGLEFPRFMLDVLTITDVDNCLSGLRLFCGVGEEVMAPAVQQKLDMLLSRLHPFKDGTRISRQPEVCLGRISSVDSVGKGNRSRGGLGSLLVRYVATVNAGISAESAYRFRLAQLTLAHYFGYFECESDINQIVDLMQHLAVKINQLPVAVRGIPPMSSSSKARVVSTVLRLDRHATRATTATIHLGQHSKPLLGAFFSALPFATSVHSIDFCYYDEFNDHDLSWLAYAMFHPDSPSSSWRALALEMQKISEKSAFVMESMARGNNLEALLHGTTPTSTAYYSARLRSNMIYDKPGDSAEVLASDIKSRVDVCGVCSTDPRTWKEWVSVVVPAYGLGWVRSSEVVDVQTHPPSRSTLVSLTLNQKDSNAPSDPEHLPAFLASVGASLQYLNVAGYCPIESTSILRCILMRCPSLAAFVVKHSGLLWSGPLESEIQSLPSLRELELHLPVGRAALQKPSPSHLHSLWSRLVALRVRQRHPDHYPRSLYGIESVLDHVPSLRYFHWEQSVGFSYTMLPSSYAQTRAWTTQLLDLIEWKDDKHRFAEDTSRTRCVAAVLSSVRQSLDRDVMGHILQFVPTRTSRVLTVDPKSSWLERDPVYQYCPM